jgi:hypothetical protein
MEKEGKRKKEKIHVTCKSVFSMQGKKAIGRAHAQL